MVANNLYIWTQPWQSRAKLVNIHQKNVISTQCSWYKYEVLFVYYWVHWEQKHFQNLIKLSIKLNSFLRKCLSNKQKKKNESEMGHNVRKCSSRMRTHGFLLTELSVFITKTCLFKYTENFTTKKNWKFSDKKSSIFRISTQKHRLWVLVRTASDEYPQSMLLSRKKIIPSVNPSFTI